MKKKTIKFTPEEEASYRELVASIRKVLDEAWVKGVDLKREHFLDCFSCECFEGMSKQGCRGVYRKDGTFTGLDVDFTVIDVKRRDYVLKKGGLRWRTTYHYICGLCGAEQTVCHVDEFSNKSTGIKINKNQRN
ncbi:MAG: hypothetical protein COW13_03340 [Candidatus Omnitrophica bacterium CG12_big_fil_rev_8_21_14_0_65_50_5]|nr:MAG: hypothetical protein COW13_03340 [Candidatus Omnitrophica bacterium CG12_big_fil_rev_8_21_14_0_65_50_5]